MSFFCDNRIIQPEDIQLYTDAAPSVGFGGYYSSRWFASAWPPELSLHSPSTTLSELYLVIIAALPWGHEMWSRNVILVHSDNLTATDIFKSLNIMKFMRCLTLVLAQQHLIICPAHNPSHLNYIAESLSWFSFQKFKSLAADLDPHPTSILPCSATIYL